MNNRDAFYKDSVFFSFVDLETVGRSLSLDCPPAPGFAALILCHWTSSGGKTGSVKSLISSTACAFPQQGKAASAG